MEHYGDAAEYASVATNSAGTALDKYNSSYLTSVEASQEKLTAQFEQLSSTIWNSDLIKGTFDTGAGLLGALTWLTEKLGALPTLAGAAGAAFSGFANKGIFTLSDNPYNASGKELNMFGSSVADIRKNGLSGEFGRLDVEALEKYNKALLDGKNSQSAYYEALLQTDGSLKKCTKATESAMNTNANLVKTNGKGAETQEALAQSLNKTGIASKAAAIGMNVLNAAMNMMASMAIAAAINFVINGIIKIANASEEAAQKAREATKEYNSNSSSLNEYKVKIQELQAALSSGDLSFDETKAKRQELMAIQDDLIDKYGSEVGGIHAVTDAINGQADAFDKLGRQDYQKWLKEVSDVSGWEQFIAGANNALSLGFFSGKAQSELDKAKAYFETLQSFEFNSVSAKLPDDTPVNITKVLTEIDRDIEKKYSLETSTVDGHYVEKFTGYATQFNDTVAEIESEYHRAIEASLNSLGIYDEAVVAKYQQIASDNLSNGLTASLPDDYQEKFDEYNTYMEGQLKYGYKYNSEYAAILEARANIEEAKLSGDSKQVDTAMKVYQQAMSSALNASKGDDPFRRYFESLYPELQEEVSKWKFKFEFEVGINPDEDSHSAGRSLKSKLNSALSKLTGLDDAGILHAQSYGTEEQQNGIAALNKIAEKYGYTLEDLIAILVEWGLVQSRIPQAVSETYTALSQLLTEQSGLREIISAGADLSAENYEKLISYSEDYAEAINYEVDHLEVDTEKVLEIAKARTEDAKAALKQAKSQKYLDYDKNAKKLKELRREQDELAKSGKKLDSVKQNELDSLVAAQRAISDEISQYNGLEMKLSDVAQAYERYYALKEQPSKGEKFGVQSSAYDDLTEGFKSGKIDGPEFQAALDLLVPDSVYVNLDTVQEKMDAIYNYYNEKLKPWLDTGKDDSSFGNVQNFIQDSLDAGLLEGSFENWTVAAGTTLDDFVEKLGRTKSTILAMMGETDTYLWGDNWEINDEFFETTEDKIYAVNKAEEELLEKKDQMLAEGTWGIDVEGTQEVEEKLDAIAEKKRELAADTVINLVIRQSLQDDIDAAKEKIEELKADLDGLDESDSEFSIKTGELEAAKSELRDLERRLSEIEEPTEVGLSLVADDVGGVIEGLQQKLEALQKKAEEEKQINTTISPETSDQIKILEDTIKALHDNPDIVLKADGEPAQKTAKELQGELDTLIGKVSTLSEQYVGSLGMDDTQLAADNAASSVRGLYTDISSLDGMSVVASVQVVKSETNSESGGVGVNGTANAEGNWQVPKSETSLTGELGREIIVRNGKWFTVGDKGAEFVDIQRGDIVFNHKQTEDLLKHGFVAGRGKAYADGTAYIGGSGSWWQSPIFNPGNGYGSSGNDNGGSGYSEAKDDVEEYISTLWQLYEVEKKLQDIQDNRDILETKLSITDNAVEQLKIQKELLEVYQAEQEAYHALAEERRKLIQDKISELEQQGFKIGYDAKTNNLFVYNMEHINELIGSTTDETNDLRKEAEDTIQTMIDWNDENIEASKTWWELKESIKDAKKEMVDASLKVHDTFLDYMDTFDLWSKSGVTKIAALTNKLKDLQRLYEQGFLSLDEYKNQWLDYAGELYDSQKEALENIVDLTKQMIKQETEDKIDALEEQIKRYAEIVKLKKEALQADKEENDHQDELNEKLNEMTKMKNRIDKLTLAANSGDRQAAAEKVSLEEDYAKLQKELTDFQSDYAYDTQMDALDKEEEAFTKSKEKEIEELRATIDTEVKLYNLAIERIDSGWDQLYQDLLAWNRLYGDGISGDDSITSSWNEATEAVKKYGYSVRDALASIPTENSQGIISGWTTPEQDPKVKSLVYQMTDNTQRWHTEPNNRAALERANEELAKQIEELTKKKVVKKNGVWYLGEAGGTPLYSIYHKGGVVGEQSVKSDELFALLKKGEWVLNKQQQKSFLSLLGQNSAIDKTKGLTQQPSAANVAGDISFAPVISYQIHADGSLTEEDARRFARAGADEAISRFRRSVGTLADTGSRNLLRNLG